MKRLFSNLLTLALLFGVGYAAFLYVNPYWFRDIVPNYVMSLAVGPETYHFPLRYIEPRYPGGEYGPANEVVIWLNLDPKTYRIMPQAVAVAGIDRIDLAVTSDDAHETKRVTDQFNALRKDEKSFTGSLHGLKMRKTGAQTDYLDKMTHITCETGNCLLFHMADKGQRLIITFAQAHLPDWRQMLDSATEGLGRAHQPPGALGQLRNILPAPVRAFFAGAAKDVKKNV